MKLRQIFLEKDKKDSFADVLPGAKVPIENLDFEQLKKLNQKINDYENTLYNYNHSKVPKHLRDSINQLKTQVQDTIDHLHNKQVEMKKDYVGEIPPKFKELMDTIAEECSEIMAAYQRTDHFLYRGVSKNTDAFKGKPFDERRAKDSDQRLSNDLNSALEAAGIEARRDNSIFVSGSLSQATNYGTGYIIFPVDGFSFSSSRKIKDFVFDFYKFRDYFLQSDDLEDLHKDLQKIDKDVLKNYFGTYHDYLSSYASKNDIFSKYDDFAAIAELIKDGHLDKKWVKYTEPKNLMTPEAVIKNLGIYSEGIDEAINSNREVTVRGAFYAINVKHENIVREYIYKIYKKSNQDDSPTTDVEIKNGDKIEIIGGPNKGVKGTASFVYSKGLVDVETQGGGLIYDVPKKDLKKIDSTDPAKSKADFELKKGDKVKLISDKHKGKTGTVDYVYMNNKEFDINLDDGTFLYSISKNDLEKLDQNVASTEPSLIQIGDAVEIIDGEHKGKTGTIEWVSKTKNIVSVNIKGLEPYGYTTAASAVKKIDTDQSSSASPDIKDIKKGDKVKVVSGIHKGAIGTVEVVFKAYDEADIKTEDGALLMDLSLNDIVKIIPMDPKDKVNGVDKDKLKKLIDKGKKVGHVTYDELNAVLPPDSVTSEQIEDVMSMFNEMGINVIDTNSADDLIIDADFEPLNDFEPDVNPLAALEIPKVGDKVKTYNLPGASALNNGKKGTVVSTKKGTNGEEILSVKFDDGSGNFTHYEKYFKKLY